MKAKKETESQDVENIKNNSADEKNTENNFGLDFNIKGIDTDVKAHQLLAFLQPPNNNTAKINDETKNQDVNNIENNTADEKKTENNLGLELNIGYYPKVKAEILEFLISQGLIFE